MSPPPPAPLPTSLQLTATPAPHKHLVFILLQEAREGDPVSDRERFCVGHSCGHCQVYSGKERTEPADDRRVPGQPTAVQQGCSGVSRRPLSHDLIRELSGQGCFNPLLVNNFDIQFDDLSSSAVSWMRWISLGWILTTLCGNSRLRSKSRVKLSGWSGW